MHPKFESLHQQGLYDSWCKRIGTTDDVADAERLLNEVQAHEIYQSPGHPDHKVFLHLLPAALAHQSQVQGDDPYGSGSPRVDGVDRHDFANPLDYENAKSRTRVEQMVSEIAADPDHSPAGLEGAQDVMDDLNADQAERGRIEAEGNALIEALEAQWAEEERLRKAEIKADFMKAQLRGVMPDDVPKAKALAEQFWRNKSSGSNS